ncbi:MAG: aminotransferase class I/II-fold pyridoxal phosphate-dependent enzyme [Bdellovibrio sp.]
MSRIEKSIRNRRYSVKSGKSIEATVDMNNGEQIKGQVVDCSLTGFRATFHGENVNEDSVQIGAIWPATKLKTEKGEIFLGRLVIRRFFNNPNGGVDIAFSTIDSKIPVQSQLSHFLDHRLDDVSALDKELSSEHFSLAHFVENENNHADLFQRVRDFFVFQKEWQNSEKYGYKMVREPSFGPRVLLSRPRKGDRKDYIVMGSNDYLGLGAHPKVVAAAKEALDQYGFGSTGSPVTTGTTAIHNELCEKLALLHNKKSALLFNSGYAANIGIITAITTANDLIIADQLCHASIQDAMQMSKATSRFFKHNDSQHLRQILEKERESYNGALVITEGVFSMDGDTARLDEIYAVAREFNCRIMVDQAHCFGVVGPKGLGIVDKYNLSREVDIIMGTFSKICGGIGGFVTASEEVVEWIRMFGRSQLFSVSIPPSTAAAVLKSLELFSEDKTLHSKLLNNIQHFKKGLETLGYRFQHEQESAVIPVVIGDETKMGRMYQSLLDDGVWVVPIVYPAVGRKNCRFRFTIMATHSVAELDYALSALEKAMIKVGHTFEQTNSNETIKKKSA